MKYANLIGGLVTCQFPYIFVILFGWFFSKLHALDKDMSKPIAKTAIFVFLPFYYFMWVSQATSAQNLSNYYLIIISEIVKTAFGIVISFLYIYLTNMDYRYRYTWMV